MPQPLIHSSRRNPAGPVRAALYARVSTDQQAEQHTIDSQVRDLLARAATDGHDIGEAFRFLDDGHSGATLVRPALERLRDLVALAAIHVVYVHAPDRLARSYPHQAILVEEFARAGTEIIFLNRPIGQSPEDNLLLQLQGMFAEYERARLLERSRRGKRYLAQAGIVSVLGRAPYGYRFLSRKTGEGEARFEVIEEKAEVVRRIFRWVAREHVTLSAVCRRLFEAGVPSPTGKARWSRTSVHSLLSNSAYAGQAIFGKHAAVPWQPPLRPARGRSLVPKRPARNILAPPEQWITVPVPALVEPDLFDRAQAQLAENRQRIRARLSGPRYRLQGLLVCLKGGYAFCGCDHFRPSRQTKHHYRYYRCCGSEGKRFDGQCRCDAQSIAVDRLDAAVWSEVCRVLRDPARVLEEYQRRLEAAGARPHSGEFDTIDRQIAKLRRGIGRLIDSYADGVLEKDEFEPRLATLRRRLAGLEAESDALHEAAEQAWSLQLVIGKLETFTAVLGDRLETADWETRREIIRTLVSRIEIGDDTIRVIFRIDPGPNDGGGARQILQCCPERVRLRASGQRRDRLVHRQRHRRGDVRRLAQSLRRDHRRRPEQTCGSGARRGRIACSQGPGAPRGHRVDVPAGLLTRTPARRTSVAPHR
jgi:site-specific DNA recombinase